MFRAILVILLVVVIGVVLVLSTTLIKVGGTAAIGAGKAYVGAK